MIEHSDIWYKDEGGLTKVICEECKYCLCVLSVCVRPVTQRCCQCSVAASAIPYPVCRFVRPSVHLP